MEKKKILALISIIVVEIIGLFFFIWCACQCDGAHSYMAFYAGEEYLYNEYKVLFVKWLFIMFAALILVFGNTFTFYYVFKNNFILTKEEREQHTKERAERRKKAKRAKLEKQLEELNN